MALLQDVPDPLVRGSTFSFPMEIPALQVRLSSSDALAQPSTQRLHGREGAYEIRVTY